MTYRNKQLGNTGPLTNVGDLTRVQFELTKNGKPKYAVIRLTALERERAEVAVALLQQLPNIDSDPLLSESMAAQIVVRHLPSVVHVVGEIYEAGFPLIVIKDLPAQRRLVETPADGIVDNDAVRPAVGFLTGILRQACNVGAFSYLTENNGRILRAVAPVKRDAGKASSQGFDNDLGWHNDNTPCPMVFEPSFRLGRAPMNPLQGFVAIKTRQDVPMEMASLDDFLFDLEVEHSADVILQLSKPVFGARWPDSHVDGGRVAIEGVPLIVADQKGHWHCRYHVANVFGCTPEARIALNKLHDATSAADPVVEVFSAPGDLIVYSNTRMMHRRRAFAPRFDGSDRYYVRVYFSPLASLTNHRILN